MPSFTQMESWDTEEEVSEEAKIFLINNDTASDSMPDLISNSSEEENDNSSFINTPEKIRMEDEAATTMGESNKKNGENLATVEIESPEEETISGTSKDLYLKSTSVPEAMQQDAEKTRKNMEEQKIGEERTQKGLKLLEEVKMSC